MIVNIVKQSIFFNSIETFGTAIARNSKTYRVKKDSIIGNLNIDGRFVKAGEIIAALKDKENIVADFNGKLGKREIAQGVLGSDSLIITLDDLKKSSLISRYRKTMRESLNKDLKLKFSHHL